MINFVRCIFDVCVIRLIVKLIYSSGVDLTRIMFWWSAEERTCIFVLVERYKMHRLSFVILLSFMHEEIIV